MESNDIFADAKARRERWESGERYWRRFVEDFLVGKGNFLFKGNYGEEILTGESFPDVVQRYSPLRDRNLIDSFKEGARAQYGNAPHAVKMTFTHILYAYKLIERAKTAAAVNNKKEFVCCIGDLGELDPDLYWDGVAGTGSGYNKPGESVGFFLDALVHLAQSNKTSSFGEVNETILAFCKERYNQLQTGGKWMADVLFWYVAPDKYEPIISQAAKKQIARKLKGLVENHPEYSSDMIQDDFKVNKVISLIRQEFVKQGMRDTFNFYDADVERQWREEQKMTTDEHAKKYWLWLVEKVPSVTSAERYFYALKPKRKSNQLNDLAKELGFIDGVNIHTLLDIRDKDEFENLKKALERHGKFFEFNNKKGGDMYGQALRHYNEYLAEGAQGNGDSSSEQDNAKNGDNVMAETKQTPLNQIFYGPPGTGKTYHAIPAALEIIGGDAGFDELRQEGQIAMVTFHENFAYEEFIEGIKPVLNTGELSYQMEAGIFKEIAKKADESRQAGDGKNYVLIIDEINRGNLSRIFGELITLIESDKRLGQENELRLTLPYSKEDFGVPDNLYIIGTMNTADRSTTKLDTALRRRFHFVEMMPNPEKAAEHSSVPGVDCGKLLKAINRQICLWRDREHQIGHTYFMGLKNIDDLKDAFQDKIIPLLQEYFFADWGKIDLALNKNGFIVSEKAQADDEEMTLYEKLPSNDPAWTQAANYKKIYGEE